MRNILNTAFRSSSALAVVAAYFALLTWWIFLHTTNASANHLLLWGTAYQALAWWGAILGLFISKRWGGLNSLVGRAAIAFSLGLLCQGFGQSAYAWYVFYLKIEIPYPSIGDIGYFGSIFFYLYGAYMLAKISGVKVSLKSYANQIQAIIIPALMLGVSYIFFLRYYIFDWSQPLKTFLDFGYPLGQALYVSVAILAISLSWKMLGGVMRIPIFCFIVALIAQYISDFSFLYQASQGTFYAGGINDQMYSVSYALMAIALIYIGNTYHNIKEN